MHGHILMKLIRIIIHYRDDMTTMTFSRLWFQRVRKWRL